MPGQYDDLVAKATSEDLVSEAWDINLQISDKVQEDGETGAKEVVAALLKRLSHRNPNVQIFTLELANSLVQNNGKTTHAEISSRAWTGALDRLVTDRTTNAEVKKRTLRFIKEWTKEFGEDPNLGMMRELMDSLKAKKIPFDEPAKAEQEDTAQARLRQEEEELQRVLELSKQDKGGRSAQVNQTSGSSSSYHAQPPNGSGSGLSHTTAAVTANNNTTSTATGPKPYPARSATPPPIIPSKAEASRVRAIYPFVTTERGELSFERGDVIKVIDRMYDEWYTGAVGGKIGIFPISYVEPLPDPTPEELQREAQEEARVFAAQGMIVNLQRMLDSLDPSAGDRLDDPALEEMYQKAVALQPQIVALMKKYTDQKAELEHIHLGFVKASRQYAKMTQPQQQAIPAPYPEQLQAYPGQPTDQYQTPATQAYAGYGLPPPAADQYASQYPSDTGANGVPTDEAARIAAEQHRAAWAAYYAQQAAAQQSAQIGGSSQPVQQAGPPAVDAANQTQAERDHIAAWQAYYAAQAQAQAMAEGPQHGAQGQQDAHQEGSHPQQQPYPSQQQLQPGQPMAHPYQQGGAGATSVGSLHSQQGVQVQQGYRQSQYGQRPSECLEQGMGQMSLQSHP